MIAIPTRWPGHCLALLLVALLIPAASVRGAEWGTLKGRFIYDGKPPEVKKVNVTKDVEVCTLHHPVVESLVVGESSGLVNVVVYIRTARGKKLAIHADYDAQAEKDVVLDNKNCRFEPHICLLWTKQKLVLKNSDPVGHNTKADLFSNASFNVLIPAGGSQEKSLTKGEGLPMPVGCNIHPWMSGHLLIREDPYMVVSGEDGSFELANIPVGEHEFQFWQEKCGNLRDISFSGGKADRRGRAKIKIKTGDNDLGEIKVNEKLFAGK
jgi:hypothetical protein